MSKPVVVTVNPFPQEMRNNLLELEQEWIPALARFNGDLRFISRTSPFDLSKPRARAERRLKALRRRETALRPLVSELLSWKEDTADLEVQAIVQRLVLANQSMPDEFRLTIHDVENRQEWAKAIDKLSAPLWRLKWIQDERQMYEDLDNSSLRSLRHFCIAWCSDRGDKELEGMIKQTFQTHAQASGMPNLLDGVYEEQLGWKADHCYLAPQEPHLPLVALLVAYDLTGDWDVTTLGRLFNLDLDLAICIDAVKVPHIVAEQQVNFIKNSRKSTIKTSDDGGHFRTHRKLQTAEYIEQVLDQGQELHDIRFVVAVFGRDLEELNTNVEQVISAGGARIKLLRPPGGQTQLAKFFTTTPSAQIGGFSPFRREPTHGLACMIPFGYRRYDQTDGLLFMLEGDTPIFINPMRDRSGDKRAGHAVFIGKTGSGKTFLMFTIAMRMLEAGYQVVFFEPQGHSRRFINACGRGGARYELSMRHRINLLDVAVGRSHEGEPPALGEQIQHVIAQLSTVLGQVIPTANGRGDFQAHRFSPIERGILDQALTKVYAPWADNLELLSLEETPILSDLCNALKALPVSSSLEKVRDHLYDLLTVSLVESSLGATYNHTTTVRWNFEGDATAYDFTAMGKDSTTQILFASNALAALSRYVRSAARDRNRPMAVFFDEFAYTLGRSPELAAWAADATKTWRTFGVMLVTCDQDASTYLGTNEDNAVPALLNIFNNTGIKIFFKQDLIAAERLGDVIDGLQPSHVRAIREAKKGDFVLVMGSDDPNHQYNEVFFGRVVPTDLEMLTFSGT